MSKNSFRGYKYEIVFKMPQKLLRDLETHLRSKTLFLICFVLCISRSRARCKKPHKNILYTRYPIVARRAWPSASREQRYLAYKNLILCGSYEFLNLAHNACTKFKSRYLKTTLGTFFEKTIQARGLKVGSYVPLLSFYKLISRIKNI